MRLFGERLLEREGAYLRFYCRDILEDLLEKTYLARGVFVADDRRGGWLRDLR
jgi:hypothetical protein